jgi:hypothetical protein
VGLFRRNKKSAEVSSRRRPQVSSQKSANYNYYQSRDTSGSNEPTKRTKSIQQRLKHIPTYIAAVVILVAISYASTLTTTPKIIVVNDDDPSVQQILKDTENYRQAASERLSSSVLNRSKLTINTSALEEQLYEQIPEATDIGIALPILGRNPIVYLRIAQPALVLSTNDNQSFVIDEQGRAVLEAPEKVNAKDLITVKDKSGLAITPGSFVLTKDDVTFITDINRSMKQAKTSVKHMTLPLLANEVDVYLKDQDYYVKFSSERGVEEQVGAFLATKQQLAKDNVQPTKYIDVRVEGRTFTK